MRHLYLVGLLTVFSWHAMSQTFQKSLEPTGVVPITTLSDYNPGFSTYTNYENRLHNYEAPFMNSLLEMYETTLDPVFLDRFLVHAYNVLNRRDDILALDPGMPVDGLGNVPKPSGGQPIWSFRLSSGTYSNQWSTEIVTQGIISFPMAKFAYLIKVKYPNLKTRPTPSEITGWDKTGWYHLDDYADCAEFLKIKVNQTNTYLESKWNSNYNCYFTLDDSGNSVIASPNYHASIGRVQAYMYKIYEIDGDASARDYYLNRVRAIAFRLVLPPMTGITRDLTNHIISWKYGDPADNTKYEDICHGILIMEFADLCNLFGLTYGNGGAMLFDNGFMYDLANTFKTKMITGPLKYSMSITGIDGQATQLASYPEGHPVRYDQYMNAGRYLFLARHIPDLYNMIADYNYEFSLYGPGTYPMYINDGAAQCKSIDVSSQLAHGRTGFASVFQNYLDIRAVKRTPTYHAGSDVPVGSIWKAVASGKFDPTKTADLFVAAKSTGVIEIREFDPTTKKISNSLATYTPTFITADWGGITAGDFIAGNNRSEFIAFNKIDKKLYLFRYNGTTISLVNSYVTNINWAGIASGNLDASGTDELLLLSKDNGQVYGYRITLTNGIYNLTGFTITNSSTSTYVVSEAAKIAVGNLDNNLANGLEIVTLNNNNGSDYNIKVLNYTFSGSNMTFTSAAPFTGTTGNYSQWDGLTTGDFNGDGFDEIMLHRDYDGDFHIQYFRNGAVKSLCKENFPTNWDLGVMCSTSFPGSSIKHLISLRNNDGHMFAFLPFDLPTITGRPANPEGSGGSTSGTIQSLAGERIIEMADLIVSPNPTDGVVEVVLPEENSGKITVISSLGQIVLEIERTDLSRNQKIDLSDYPSGIYLLKVETKEGILTKKIWKE